MTLQKTVALFLVACAVPAAAIAQPIAPYRWFDELGPLPYPSVIVSPNQRFVVIDTDSGMTIHNRDTKARWSLGISGGQAVWSPQGDRIAFVSREGGQLAQVWSMPMNATSGKPTGAAQRITVNSGERPDFSPDGKSVVFVRGGDLVVVPVTGGEERALVRGEQQNPVSWPCFSPDSKWVYFNRMEGTDGLWVRRVPAVGGASSRVMKAPILLGISPSGKYMAYYHGVTPAADDGATIGFATIDGVEFAKLRLPEVTYLGRWNRDDHFIFENSDIPGGLNRVTIADRSLREISPPSTYDRNPALSPDGRYLAVQRWIDDDHRLMLLDPSGTVIRTLTTIGRFAGGQVWSPDSKYLAFVNAVRQLEVVDVATGRARVLYDAGTGRRVSGGSLAWRSNSKSIGFISLRHESWQVREASIDSGSTLLREVSGPEISWMLRGKKLSIHFLDDQHLLLVRPGKISVMPNSGGAERTIFEGEHGAFANNNPFTTSAIGLAIAPDATQIAVTMKTKIGAQSVAVLSTSGGAPRLLGFEKPCGVRPFGWHPDGRHVLVWNADCKTWRFDASLVPTDGGTAISLTAVDKAARDIDVLTISPDGRYVIFDSDRAWLARIGDIDVGALAAKATKR